MGLATLLIGLATLLIALVLMVTAGALISPTLTRRSTRRHATGTRARPIDLNAARRRSHLGAPRPTVSVVIPAFNEEKSIDWVLEHLPRSVSEVVLVDGLSTDLTEAVARTMRPDLVVVHQHERGKGAALRAGFAAASSGIVVMIDADGSMDPRELDRFVDTLAAGADFVKGSRYLDGGGSSDLTALRRAGNRGFVLLVNLLYGSRFTDLCYGYCAFWRRHLEDLALTADGFEIETELVLNAVRAGLKIGEVPSLELPRRAGTSNLSAFRDGKRVLGTIVRHRTSRRGRAQAPGTAIELLALEKASHDSGAWLPAGHDRRRGDRRKLERVVSGYAGPERRRGGRRQQPQITSTVYVAAGPSGQLETIASGSRANHRSWKPRAPRRPAFNAGPSLPAVTASSAAVDAETAWLTTTAPIRDDPDSSSTFIAEG
jgi:hypothetical protein